MALPTKTDLEKMDWAHKGQPFVDVPAKSSIDIKTMDYGYRAQPFVNNPASAEEARIIYHNLRRKLLLNK